MIPYHVDGTCAPSESTLSVLVPLFVREFIIAVAVEVDGAQLFRGPFSADCITDMGVGLSIEVFGSDKVSPHGPEIKQD